MFKRMPDVQPRLADDVYEQILSAIINGQIAPGERLIQEKIAKFWVDGFDHSDIRLPRGISTFK